MHVYGDIFIIIILTAVVLNPIHIELNLNCENKRDRENEIQNDFQPKSNAHSYAGIVRAIIYSIRISHLIDLNVCDSHFNKFKRICSIFFPHMIPKRKLNIRNEICSLRRAEHVRRV